MTAFRSQFSPSVWALGSGFLDKSFYLQSHLVLSSSSSFTSSSLLLFLICRIEEPILEWSQVLQISFSLESTEL